MQYTEVYTKGSVRMAGIFESDGWRETGKRIWLVKRVGKRRRGIPEKDIGQTNRWNSEAKRDAVEGSPSNVKNMEREDKGHLILGRISATPFHGRRVVDYIDIYTFSLYYFFGLSIYVFRLFIVNLFYISVAFIN